jgi:hypothetical protein
MEISRNQKINISNSLWIPMALQSKSLAEKENAVRLLGALNTGRFSSRRDRPANALIRRERDGAL